MLLPIRRAAPRLLVFCLAILTVSTLAPAPARAASGASIVGSVVDPDGARVVGATVAVTTAAGLAASSRTDASGRFDVPRLAPGAYELRISYPGLTVDPVPVALVDGQQLELVLAARLSAITDVLVVTASQVETPLARTPAAVTVFTGQDIEARQAASVADLLRLAPGLSVARSGGQGALTSVFPRGGESDYTLVLVDGVRVNSMGGGIDVAGLPVAGIERVEIVRGPQSAIHGADAIGGVVQIITRSGGPARLDALAEAGSQATSRISSTFAGSAGRWSWGASGERTGSDGFNDTTTAAGQTVTNDDGHSRLAAVHVGVGAPTWSVATQARVVQTERGFPGPFGRDPNGTYGGIDAVSRGWNEHKTLGLQATATPATRLRIRGSASYADLDGRFRSSFGSSFSDTRRIDARGQVDILASQALSFTAGAEVLDERGRSTYITGQSPSPLPIHRRVTGTFVEGRLSLSDRLSTAAGLRVEHIERSSLEGSSTRPAFDADTVVSANPRLSVSWLVRPAAAGASNWTRLRASTGTGIRPPDAFEIAFTDNPDLAPERSRSFDVSLEQGLLDGRAIVDTTWFDNRYDDLIVAVGRAYQDASRYRTDNIANARARGLEVGVALRPLGWASVRGAYTWLDSEILAVDGASGLAPSPFDPGDDLVRRPRHQGYVEAIATLRRVSAFARFGARGRVLDIDPSFGAFGGKLDAAGFASVDAGGSLTVWQRVAVFARATNLFNRTYEEVLGFPATGRAIVAGVRVAAGH